MPPESDPPPTPPVSIDPMLPSPPGQGGNPVEPRLVPRQPRFPIGAPYIAEPGMPPYTFYPPGGGPPVIFEGVPPLQYTPLQPIAPPYFVPGMPIPPNMPPAWAGGMNGALRPPYPWEPMMINPAWNPSGVPIDWPTYVPNPGYQPNYPVPKGYGPVVPRPGPAPGATVPIDPPHTIGTPIPNTRPNGFWPGVAGGVRVVLGLGGAAAAVASLFDPGHYDAARECVIRFLEALGYTNYEADQMYEGMRIKQDDAPALDLHLKAIIQKGCDSGTNLAGINPHGPCGAWAQNILAAVKLCRCKRNPPDQTVTNAAKASLLLRIANHRASDDAMRAEMDAAKAEADNQAAWYAVMPGGNWCSGKWAERAAAIQAMLEARTYVVTWFDLKRNADKVEAPTCENRISPAAVADYFQALNTAMDAAVAAFQAQQEAWNAWKAGPTPAAIGCSPLNPPSNQ